MMTTKTSSRVCAVGSEEDMRLICRALLSNRGWLPAEAEDAPPMTLEALLGHIRRRAVQAGGPENGFCYAMVAEHPYGNASPAACRLEVNRHPCGVWTALFVYGGDTAFQPEDWLALHRQCRGVPMLALYADWDFGLEKGMKRFIGGKCGDDWARMGETWMWLIAAYEDGYPPEETVRRLRRLRETLEREDFDLTIPELLARCIANLEAIHRDTEDSEAIAEHIRRCREEKDFTGLLHQYLRLAESALWETAHIRRWLASLHEALAAWETEEGAGL